MWDSPGLFQAGNEARTRFLKANERLVFHVARKYVNRGLDIEVRWRCYRCSPASLFPTIMSAISPRHKALAPPPAYFAGKRCRPLCHGSAKPVMGTALLRPQRQRLHSTIRAAHCLLLHAKPAPLVAGCGGVCNAPSVWCAHACA